MIQQIFAEEENSEYESEQSQDSSKYMCSSCYQPVTNPICEQCYKRHVEIWLKANTDKYFREKIIEKIKDKIKVESVNCTRCIICGKERVALCTFCFFFKVESVLTSLKFPQKKIESFLEIFNYGIYHSECINGY